MARLPAQLIRAKRDGGELTDDEIRELMVAITDGSIPDYQVSALLMAIFFRGLSDRELATWADAMVRSGDVLDLSAIARAKVDKHSTGGVGDKISLPLAPAVAACGVAVPMVSGRGLGHTGGTLDKLEAIPGFRVDLSVERFAALVDELGVCLIGQTARIAPADKRLYALRDVTGTVESIPLIASSIMSKKLAEGIDGLVLDCKVGRGAFMKRLDDARALCKAIRTIGEAAGKQVTCVLTAMDAPIGTHVGNALEVLESVRVLQGGGPADTRELTVVLGGEMLALGGVVADAAAGAARIAAALDDGSALAVFRRLVEAQGGDPRVCDDPEAVLPRARVTEPLVATTAGVITAVDAEDVGVAGVWLGAGRRTKEDAVVPGAGVVLAAQVGERVEVGQLLATLHHDAPGGDRVDQARHLVTDAFRIDPAATATAPGTRVLEVLRGTVPA
ncbi:MAG: thymidine phosphorylase [Kofleriaceae bacterium]|nr:thymidine phosphorylase [Kofleriaceae bacterium]